MQRLTITIPIHDNNGVSFTPGVLAEIEHNLLNLFGGFTVCEVSGAWSEAGKVFHDKSRRYEIYTGIQGYGRLKAYALSICITLRQECILVTKEPVEVNFIKLPKSK